MIASEAPVPIEEKEALAALVTAYVVEMCAIIGVPPGDGRYALFDLYWTEDETRWPFWIKADGANAGFALIRRDRELERTEIAEFYVAQEFRRQRIGLTVARRLIAQFSGPWRITQREANAGAIDFWHRVLDGFVAYDESVTATDAVRREQRFTIV